MGEFHTYSIDLLKGLLSNEADTDGDGITSFEEAHTITAPEMTVRFTDHPQIWDGNENCQIAIDLSRIDGSSSIGANADNDCAALAYAYLAARDSGEEISEKGFFGLADNFKAASGMNEDGVSIEQMLKGFYSLGMSYKYEEVNSLKGLEAGAVILTEEDGMLHAMVLAGNSGPRAAVYTCEEGWNKGGVELENIDPEDLTVKGALIPAGTDASGLARSREITISVSSPGPIFYNNERSYLYTETYFNAAGGVTGTTSHTEENDAYFSGSFRKVAADGGTGLYCWWTALSPYAPVGTTQVSLGTELKADGSGAVDFEDMNSKLNDWGWSSKLAAPDAEDLKQGDIVKMTMDGEGHCATVLEVNAQGILLMDNTGVKVYELQDFEDNYFSGKAITDISKTYAGESSSGDSQLSWGEKAVVWVARLLGLSASAAESDYRQYGSLSSLIMNYGEQFQSMDIDKEDAAANLAYMLGGYYSADNLKQELTVDGKEGTTVGRMLEVAQNHGLYLTPVVTPMITGGTGVNVYSSLPQNSLVINAWEEDGKQKYGSYVLLENKATSADTVYSTVYDKDGTTVRTAESYANDWTGFAFVPTQGMIPNILSSVYSSAREMASEYMISKAGKDAVVGQVQYTYSEADDGESGWDRFIYPFSLPNGDSGNIQILMTWRYEGEREIDQTQVTYVLNGEVIDGQRFESWGLSANEVSNGGKPSKYNSLMNDILSDRLDNLLVTARDTGRSYGGAEGPLIISDSQAFKDEIQSCLNDLKAESPEYYNLINQNVLVITSEVTDAGGAYFGSGVFALSAEDVAGSGHWWTLGALVHESTHAKDFKDGLEYDPDTNGKDWEVRAVTAELAALKAVGASQEAITAAEQELQSLDDSATAARWWSPSIPHFFLLASDVSDYAYEASHDGWSADKIGRFIAEFDSKAVVEDGGKYEGVFQKAGEYLKEHYNADFDWTPSNVQIKSIASQDIEMGLHDDRVDYSDFTMLTDIQSGVPVIYARDGKVTVEELIHEFGETELGWTHEQAAAAGQAYKYYSKAEELEGLSGEEITVAGSEFSKTGGEVKLGYNSVNDIMGGELFYESSDGSTLSRFPYILPEDNGGQYGWIDIISDYNSNKISVNIFVANTYQYLEGPEYSYSMYYDNRCDDAENSDFMSMSNRITDAVTKSYSDYAVAQGHSAGARPIVISEDEEFVGQINSHLDFIEQHDAVSYKRICNNINVITDCEIEYGAWNFGGSGIIAVNKNNVSSSGFSWWLAGMFVHESKHEEQSHALGNYDTKDMKRTEAQLLQIEIEAVNGEVTFYKNVGAPQEEIDYQMQLINDIRAGRNQWWDEDSIAYPEVVILTGNLASTASAVSYDGWTAEQISSYIEARKAEGKTSLPSAQQQEAVKTIAQNEVAPAYSALIGKESDLDLSKVQIVTGTPLEEFTACVYEGYLWINNAVFDDDGALLADVLYHEQAESDILAGIAEPSEEDHKQAHLEAVNAEEEFEKYLANINTGDSAGSGDFYTDSDFSISATAQVVASSTEGVDLAVDNVILQDRNEWLAKMLNLGKGSPEPVERIELTQTADGVEFRFENPDKGTNYECFLFEQGTNYSDDENALDVISIESGREIEEDFDLQVSGEYALKLVPTGEGGATGKYSVFEFTTNPAAPENAGLEMRYFKETGVLHYDFHNYDAADDIDRYDVYLSDPSDENDKIQLGSQRSNEWDIGNSDKPERLWSFLMGETTGEIPQWMREHDSRELQVWVVAVAADGKESAPLIMSVKNVTIEPEAPESALNTPYFSQPEGSLLCGVKTTAMLLGYYGISQNEAEIIRGVKYSESGGTKNSNIISYLGTFGDVQNAEITRFEDLESVYDSIQGPMIYYEREANEDGQFSDGVNSYYGHFIVITGIDEQDNVYVNDPLCQAGPRIWTKESFEKFFLESGSDYYHLAIYFDRN
ncbi:MAG: cysteine peptidase family C39 domain-containing protein [Candidatus Omnitrophota bacterium]|jgi:hypothetical protein